ncbi:MAG: DedA family protein [Rubrobacter sp.]|jgi:membrane protein YqaA with SNARE-associated domain|nr:DedA family protein [Rubrobacter sp.]
MAVLASYATLFALSIAGATAIPMSSEPPLIYLVRTEQGVALPVLVATIGNVLGACTTYLIGRGASRALMRNRKPMRGQESAARLLKRYGQPVLLLSWVPFVGHALVALAGAAGMRFWSFCFWVGLGKGLRFLAIALAAVNFF